jgi:hypothetical protein
MQISRVKKLKGDDEHIIAAFKITPVAEYQHPHAGPIWLALRKVNGKAEVFARKRVDADMQYDTILQDSYVNWHKVYRRKDPDNECNKTHMITMERNDCDEEEDEDSLFVCSMDPLLAFWQYHKRLSRKTKKYSRDCYRERMRTIIRHPDYEVRYAFDIEEAFFCQGWTDDSPKLVENIKILEIADKLIDDVQKGQNEV